MGFKITPAGKAIPGRDGVPGWAFSNREIFNRLHPWYNFGSKISSKLNGRIKKELELFERTTGIEERGLLVDEKKKLPYPTERLGIHAAINGFDNINKNRINGSQLKPSDIDGFIFVSNTQERVFTPGREICNALEINPQYYSFVGGLSCSGFVEALRKAATIFASERHKDINNIVIVVSEVTSKLRQEDGDDLQSLLFGDGAVMFLIERSEKGGIQIWGPNIDLESPDVMHFTSHSGEDAEIAKKQKEVSSGNNPRLKEFAFYEVNKMPSLFRLFMNHSISRTAEHQAVVLPQIAKKVNTKTLEHFKENVPLRVTIASSSLPKHANTGATATPLAWLQSMEKNEILIGEIVTTFNCGFGGSQAITTYDPNADKALVYYNDETVDIVLEVEHKSVINGGLRETLLYAGGGKTVIETHGDGTERNGAATETNEATTDEDAARRLREKMKV